jgi:hypothetical protein
VTGRGSAVLAPHRPEAARRGTAAAGGPLDPVESSAPGDAGRHGRLGCCVNTRGGKDARRVTPKRPGPDVGSRRGSRFTAPAAWTVDGVLGRGRAGHPARRAAGWCAGHGRMGRVVVSCLIAANLLVHRILPRCPGSRRGGPGARDARRAPGATDPPAPAARRPGSGGPTRAPTAASPHTGRPRPSSTLPRPGPPSPRDSAARSRSTPRAPAPASHQRQPGIKAAYGVAPRWPRASLDPDQLHSCSAPTRGGPGSGRSAASRQDGANQHETGTYRREPTGQVGGRGPGADPDALIPPG